MLCISLRCICSAAVVAAVAAFPFELDVEPNDVEEGISLLQKRVTSAPDLSDSASSSNFALLGDSVLDDGRRPHHHRHAPERPQDVPERNAVVTISTLGNLDFVQNWARSLEAAGVQHYYVYAIGPGAYEGLSQALPGRVRKVPHEHLLFSSSLSQNEGSASEHWGYKSEDYSQLMLSVPGITKWLLEEVHESFLYTDTDIVAFSDPFTAFPDGYREASDLLGSVDGVLTDEEAWDTCSGEHFCGGLWWVQRTTASLAFVSRWSELAAAAPKGSKNQPLYNEALEFAKQEQHGSLRVGILSCERFPNGARYFHSSVWRSASRRPEAMIHANAFIGADKKRLALNASCLWYPEGISNSSSTHQPLELPQMSDRLLLFRNVRSSSSAHNLALRLNLHRVALQFAFANNLALVTLPALRDNDASQRSLSAMLSLEPISSEGESSSLPTTGMWEVDAAQPVQGEEAWAENCVTNVPHATGLAKLAPEGPLRICLDVSAWNRTKTFENVFLEQDSHKALRTDLWFRRRARVARPGSTAFQPRGPLRVVVPSAGMGHLPDKDTSHVLSQVLRVLSEARYVRNIEVEMVSEKSNQTISGQLLEMLQVPDGMNVAVSHWSPANPDDASKPFLERIASAAVIVLPTESTVGSLWLWAARLSHGIVLAHSDLVGQNSLAERDSAGLVVPWARHLHGSGNANAHFDPNDFARAWHGSCLTGWDGGVAESVWNDLLRTHSLAWDGEGIWLHELE